LGLSIIIISIFLAAWAVIEAGIIGVDKPSMLLIKGPYARSRNPMYLAWHGITLGIALIVNTFWLIVLFPLIFLYIHFFDIRKEENHLEARFGDQYREYYKKVRRYL